MLGFPVTFSETPCALRHVPPKLGEHDTELLSELGFTPDEIAQLSPRAAAQANAAE